MRFVLIVWTPIVQIVLLMQVFVQYALMVLDYKIIIA